MALLDGCWDIVAFIISCYVPSDVPALIGTCKRVFATLRVEALIISAEQHLSFLHSKSLYHLLRSTHDHDISTSLTSLTFYNISDSIKLFSDYIVKLKVLRELRVDKCGLWESLPTSLNYRHLQSIILNNLDYLLYLPSQINVCEHLHTFKIINCNSIVTTKYQEILFLHLAQLQNLQKLFIMNCENFKEIHPSLEELKKLTYINFSGNRNIEALNYLHVSNLKTIIMNHTNITYYPYYIYLYANVRYYRMK